MSDYITNCYRMFYHSNSITKIDLSKFHTKQVQNMLSMFSGCSSLTSLNLLNFATSNVEMMDYMFYGCSSLTSLDLSMFTTSKVQLMEKMFYNCQNLEYINLQNFKQNSLKYYGSMFNNVPTNVVVCINKDAASKIYGKLGQKCKEISCSENWKSKQKKVDPKNKCINNCITNTPYINEYNGKCVDNCPKGYIINNSTHKICKCQLDKCLTCPKVALEKNLCTKCNIGYYPK